MALSRTLCNVVSAIPTLHLGLFSSDHSDHVAAVLRPLNAPFIMALSCMVLCSSFKRGHELSLLLVVYGSLVNITPEPNDDQQSSGSRSNGSLLYNASLYLQAILAMSAFKDTELKMSRAGVWITNHWISVYQLMFGLATIFIIDASFISWHDLFSFICEMCDHVLDKQLTCDFSIFGWFVVSAFVHMCMNNMAVIYFKMGKSLVDSITFAVGLPVIYTTYLLPIMSRNLPSTAFYDGIVFIGFLCAEMLWVRS